MIQELEGKDLNYYPFYTKHKIEEGMLILKMVLISLGSLNLNNPELTVLLLLK